MDRNKISNQRRNDSNISNSSGCFSQKEQRTPVRKLVTPTSSLEILDGDCFDGASGFGNERSLSETSFRSWSRSSAGSVPPRTDSSLSRRTLTPVKQVSLQAVRRKEDSSDPFVDHVDVSATHLEGVRRKAWEFEPNDDDVDFSKMSIGDIRGDNNRVKQNLINGIDKSKPHQTTNNNGQLSQGHLQEKDNRAADVDNKNRVASSSSDDDEEEDEDKDENEKLKAPTELLMEFIDCLMKEDYPNASKLCKMILLYEPENEEALKFQPLIEEKMALDAAAGEETDEDDSSDDGDDEDDDDSDEDSSSGDDDSSDEEDEDDNDDAVDGTGSVKAQSAKTGQGQGSKVAGANSTQVWKPAS